VVVLVGARFSFCCISLDGTFIFEEEGYAVSLDAYVADLKEESNLAKNGTVVIVDGILKIENVFFDL